MSLVMRSIASAIARWKVGSAVPAAVTFCGDTTYWSAVWAAPGPTSSTVKARYGNSLLMVTPRGFGLTRNPRLNRTERGPTAQVKGSRAGLLMSVLGRLNALAVPCLFGFHRPGGFSGTTRSHPFRQVWTDG